MGLSRSALSHLDSAYNLFNKVTDHARAGKILVRVPPSVESIAGTERHLPVCTAYFVETAGAGTFGASEQQSAAAALGKCDSAFFLWPENQKRGGRAVGARRRHAPRLAAVIVVALDLCPRLPRCKNSPRPPSRSPQTFLAAQTNEGPSTWHNYTHVENFNVSINMGAVDYYQNGSGPAVLQEPHDDAGMYYQLPPQQHQPQLHHQQQQQQHVYHPGAPMEMSNSMYYGINGYSPGYGNINGYPMVQGAPSPEMLTPPAQPAGLMAQF